MLLIFKQTLKFFAISMFSTNIMAQPSILKQNNWSIIGEIDTSNRQFSESPPASRTQALRGFTNLKNIL